MNTVAPVLCYIEGNWAFFTTQPLDKQWGDDWDDAPYENNAGRPYEFHAHDSKAGKERWEITKVAWDGDFETPGRWGGGNSHYSVQSINSGAAAWLFQRGYKEKPPISIQAGTTLDEFVKKITQGKGCVYFSKS